MSSFQPLRPGVLDKGGRVKQGQAEIQREADQSQEDRDREKAERVEQVGLAQQTSVPQLLRYMERGTIEANCMIRRPVPIYLYGPEIK